ncbi:hypothetical protein MCAMS1_00681 [biofilm metagenome]
MPHPLSTLAQVRSCDLCASHLPFPPKPILQIHPEACILIAGQAPGRKAHDAGRPFADASGIRLRDWLGIPESVFYSETTIAILPMGFCYPGSDSHGDRQPRTECAAHWRHRLLALMPNIEMTILVGHYAQAWHLGKNVNLTETVRNWRAVWPCYLPIPHPSPRNNLWIKRNPWFETEILPKAKERIAALITN